MTCKFFETNFNEYISTCENENLHPELSETFENLPTNIKNLPNIILYGPKGVGKYTQSLLLLKKYSPSSLKYEKKFSITFNKALYQYKVSDIHIEIDMSLLGCNAKLLWNEIYSQLIDIAYVKEDNIFIILCTNFQDIHSELLEHFYSYMQTTYYRPIKLQFIILTEHISFLSENIIDICKTISIPRASFKQHEKCFGKINTDINTVTNLKILKSGIDAYTPHKIICSSIINSIINYDDTTFTKIREMCYQLLIYDIDIYESVWYILYILIGLNKINKEISSEAQKITYNFLKLFNNNYRPIYHLESYVLYLTKLVNDI